MLSVSLLEAIAILIVSYHGDNENTTTKLKGKKAANMNDSKNEGE